MLQFFPLEEPQYGSLPKQASWNRARLPDDSAFPAWMPRILRLFRAFDQIVRLKLHVLIAMYGPSPEAGRLWAPLEDSSPSLPEKRESKLGELCVKRRLRNAHGLESTPKGVLFWEYSFDQPPANSRSRRVTAAWRDSSPVSRRMLPTCFLTVSSDEPRAPAMFWRLCPAAARTRTSPSASDSP